MPKKKTYSGPKPEEVLVNNLIELMEKGTSPWRKEWDPIHSTHMNLFTGHKYRGNNITLLTMGMYMADYELPLWFGMGQANAHKFKLRKGCKSTRILKPQVITAERELDDGQIEQVGFMRYSITPVFNVADLEGEGIQEWIDKRLETIPQRTVEERLANVESVLQPWPVPIDYAEVNPCYIPAVDRIKMPDLPKFHSRESYYATRIHEMVHSTGHGSRLNRNQRGKFGSMDYAKEELVAELGSVLLCNRLQVSSEIENHAAYLSSWISILKQEPKFLYQALSQAKKAVDLIYPDTESYDESGTDTPKS
jgi:antirestriction protein ArdC